MQIWNREMIDNQNFPSTLKFADISPNFKKFGCILKENYRPVSVLSVVSKIFERIRRNQLKPCIGKYLSPSLCGYRKGYNTQYALTSTIEKWKNNLDTKRRHFGSHLNGLIQSFWYDQPWTVNCKTWRIWLR